MMDDELDLIKGFIEYSINRTDTCFNQQEPAPQVICERSLAKGGLHFVITKNKSSSWAEDLHECRSVAERTRVYN
ncbi:MAG TPA: hypothetical protein DDY32_09550 [Desulfobulbaceae bacterium]|nr:hypothetical protein [Desulfobulbaceae bacterium]